jgi:hypothetical protein
MSVGFRRNRAATEVQVLERPPHVHTLSMRLNAEQYQRLRRFVTREQDRIGRRVSYQAIVETALTEFLDRRR